MFYLKNLSSQAMNEGVLPWEYKPVTPIPDEVRKDKKARDLWINAPATDYYVYSFNEGINANMRISKPRPDGGGNPIHSTIALVADYDSAQPLEKVMQAAKAMTYPPNWIEKTLSGNWRFVWGLTEEILHASDGFARHFFKKFPDFAFDPSRAIPGFDKKAWEAPERLWTNSCEWFFVHDATIPADISRGWLVKAGQSYQFTEREFGVAIPLDIVKAELAKKFHKFRDWTGEFAANAQGPTFWLDESVSPKSAIVRETGMQTFSAHAAKGFYSWADLLGIDFVRQYEAETIGQAVEGIYFDGRYYWRKTPNGQWSSWEKENLVLHLRVSRNLPSKPGPDGKSLVDRAVEHVHNFQKVHSAAPHVFYPAGIMHRYGHQVLNTSTVKIIQPSDESGVYGPDGNFSFISRLLGIAPEGKSRGTLLAWGSHAYKAAYRQEPTSGQVLFLIGPVGIGKTLLSREVFGKLFGGFAEAGAFLMHEDDFNGEMFDVGWWAQDDASGTVDAKKLRYFSEMIKRVAANPSFRVNDKFHRAVLSEWRGRLCITFNADEESIALLPEMTLSNREKLILIKTVPEPVMVFPSQKVIQETIDRELPYFARWLLDWEIPKEFLGDSRFGVKEFADPHLIEASRQSSAADTFLQVLDDWKKNYFGIREKTKDFWEGTALQLYKEICLDPYNETVMRDYNPYVMGRRLVSLMNRGVKIEIIETGDDLKPRMWRIYKN